MRTSPSLQAALLTAVNTGKRAFHGGIVVDMPSNVACLLNWPGKLTLNEIVQSLGGVLTPVDAGEHGEILYLGKPAKDVGDGYVLYCSGWRGGIASLKIFPNFKEGTDFALGGSSDAIGIVARAFSNRHRTEEGLQLLEENLVRRPSDPVLLLDRGILLEGLGRTVRAKESFDAAEQNADRDCRSQILICYSMFLYRQQEWSAAAEKLKILGAESVHNPLCGNYVVCLFNQGMFRESLALAEKAIKERKEFVEDFYAIAARCHHICENFPRARALLEVLVAKGGSRKIEHIKLLAWACWRMDDLSSMQQAV